MSTSIKTPDENPSNVESILSDMNGLPGYTIDPPGSRIETLLIMMNGAFASSIVASIDENFVMSITLKNNKGETIGTTQTIDLPLESVIVNGSYDSTNKKLVFVLENGNTIDVPIGDLISGLQEEITSTNKLDADLVDDTTAAHKFTTAEDISKLSGIESQANKTIVDSSITDGGTNPVTGGSIYTALAGKQSTIDSTHKVSADLIDDANATNKFATAAQLSQIETNKNNILSEQAKTTGMTEGGSNYITVNGIRVYVDSNPPTGARTGDLWIGG